MITLALRRNGKHLAAGGVVDGVVTAMVTWVTTRPGRREAELTCSLGGLETSQPQEEHVYWVELNDVKPGDEFTIVVEERPTADSPTRRSPGRARRSITDGTELVECSFCRRLRRQSSSLAGAEITICAECRALAAGLIEREQSSVFHLQVLTGGDCLFCNRPERGLTVHAGAAGVCAECLAAVPL